MHVLVHHQVRDPATFWTILLDQTERLPPELTLLQSLPNPDATVEFSLWQAEAVEVLREYLEARIGFVSRNAYYPIETRHAIGLPAVAPAA